MRVLVVVNTTSNWPLNIPGVEVVGARAYLSEPAYSRLRDARVFNLCRSYSYQSLGYYVSLLATARGHKVMPSIATIQDMKSHAVVRVVSEELDEIVQKDLAQLQSDQFVLSIYFGRNVARRYDRLSLKLFNQFPAPMLRAHFRREDGSWELRSIGPIPTSEVPASHRPYIVSFAQEYFAKRQTPTRRRDTARYDLAILVNEAEEHPPSDPLALKRFVQAATKLGMRAEFIGRDDYGSLGEYDALFIRETTQVNHHTYRFAQRAEAEGLVVIDDPESIVRCTNKVYLAETLECNRIPMPRTLVVHRDMVDQVGATLGFPCILKRPDSSFSQGVIKVQSETELAVAATRLFEDSELIVAQEFVPTEFDWRVGVFENEPLHVCKYHMAVRHWQIINWGGQERHRYGRYETLAAEAAPRGLVRTALRAARLFGNGLYGVDLKQVGKQFIVIEVNDNPSLESGVEDQVLKGELYGRIMRGFLRRLEERRAWRSWS